MTETSQWQHVASEDNPADLVSRGLEPSRLVNNELWWHGPSFIQSEIGGTPVRLNLHSSDVEYLEQETKTVMLVKEDSDFLGDILGISNCFDKIVRVLGFIFRFVSNCRGKKQQIVLHLGPLSTQELSNAKRHVVRLVQELKFKEDLAFTRSIRKYCFARKNEKSCKCGIG
ncbi:hypothetical protein JTE90_012177 [Oedothorax gibbosus]|uniref:Uncharacterized protein n=1 Tax=Oedothorax gibbosus TaxID=931172 RepID=A0AAV6TRT6_9ARAC|nr:hypothetical protein JTE90_012177 [Oedothorax gibbosus]